MNDPSERDLGAAVFFLLLGGAFGAFGWWWATEGLERGRLYGDVDELPVDRLVVDSLADFSDGPMRPDYEALGRLVGEGEPVRVDIFRGEYRELRAGDTIVVYRASDGDSAVYATESDLDESWPILRVGAVYFSWHLPVGLLFLGMGGYLLVRSVLEVRLPAPSPQAVAVRRAASADLLASAGWLRVGVVVALLVSPFMIAEGIDRGRRYGDLSAPPRTGLVVEELANLTGREILPDHRAFGHLVGTSQRIDVELFAAEYETLRLGDTLPVYRVGPTGAPLYITSDRLRESRPIWRVGGLYFSWHLPVGAMMIAVMAWAAAFIFRHRRARKRERSAS